MDKIKNWFKGLFGISETKGDINNVKSGDIIAFSGVSLFSRVIKIATKSQISHVGIAIERNGIMYVCESTTENKEPDALTGKLIKGVQLHKLKDRVKAYNGKVYYLKLKKELTKEEEETLRQSILDTHKKEVEYDMIQAIGSSLDLGRFDLLNDKNNYKLFCSELCCEKLQVINRVDKQENYSKYRPVDIIKLRCLKRKLNRLYP